MGLFDSFLKMKKTSAEVGHELFDMCIAATKEQLPVYKEIRNDIGFEIDENGATTEATEILIINMWSIAKSLSDANLDEAIRCMHGHYFEGHNEVDRVEAQKFLINRYEQYESLFDHEKGRHIILATQMLANIYNNGEVTKECLDVFAGLGVVTCFSDVMVKALEQVNKVRIRD